MQGDLLLGQALQLVLHDAHGLHDQLVIGQLASGHLFLFHDIGAVLADGWEDYPRDLVLEGIGLGLVAPHAQLVHPGFIDDAYRTQSPML